MTNEHVGRGQRQAVHRSLRQEQSPRVRCGLGAAWGCRTSCRTPLQSFAPGAGRNARQTLPPAATEAPRLSRSPRKNAQSRLLSGNVSNGNSGIDRMVPRPQTRPRHICSSPEMLPFSSPRRGTGRAQRSASSSCIEDCRRQLPAASPAASLSACRLQLQGRSSPVDRMTLPCRKCPAQHLNSRQRCPLSFPATRRAHAAVVGAIANGPCGQGGHAAKLAT